jgi:hypothetical protein
MNEPQLRRPSLQGITRQIPNLHARIPQRKQASMLSDRVCDLKYGSRTRCICIVHKAEARGGSKRLLLRNSAGCVLSADGTSVALMFGQLKIILLKNGGKIKMGKRFTVSLCAFALSILVAGCGGSDNTNMGNANAANANTTATTGTMPTTTAGSAEGEVVTTEADGVRTQTRTFRNNNRGVERVVVTTDTRTGKRTARVYTTGGEMRDLPEGRIDQALTATGDAIADAAGFVGDKAADAGRGVADKAEDVGRPVADKAEDVGRGVADKAEDVGRGAADKAEDVGRAGARGAKKVGEKTVDGAKKVGGAIKDAVKP